jgi:hypothetical protein
MIETIEDVMLPVALAGASADGDLDRARLALESLNAEWRGGGRLRVHVVTRPADMAAVASLARLETPRLDVRIVNELDIVREQDVYRRLPGWWKQQYLKLAFANYHDRKSYITLDSDVVAIRPFDETTFVEDGRLISQWEHQATQPWWSNLATVLGLPFDSKAYGLSVTPNSLATDLARAALEHLRTDAATPLQRLVELYERQMPGSAWTEYSLYTRVAELKGLLPRYHVDPDHVFARGRMIHSTSNVWGPDQANTLTGGTRKSDFSGYFLIVQSTSRVSVSIVRRFLAG